MPELPEVETIKRGLEKKIIGLTISSVEILNPKTFQGDPNKLTGLKVVNLWRRAKIFGLDLARMGDTEEGSRRTPARNEMEEDVRRDTAVAGPTELSLLFHLKMSGQIIYEGLIGGHPTKDMQLEMPNKSTRVIFTFENGSKLFFNDQRKFGWIKLVEHSALSTDNFLSNLGPEPLEKGFTWQILKSNLLSHKSTAIKVVLLDQTVIAGVGNIYANEACFNAKIDPRRKVATLTDSDFEKLHQGIIEALKNGIKHGGSTKTHFVNEEGKKGLFLDYAFVYARAGEKCKICGEKIAKIKLGGRGTFFCPKCQI